MTKKEITTTTFWHWDLLVVRSLGEGQELDLDFGF